MKHKKIQKRFHLYIDGNLPEADKVLIEQHLNECDSCKKHFEVLAELWNEERKLAQPLPSPALWYNLKNRMEGKTKKPILIREMIGNAKLLLNTAFTVVAVVFAIIIGSRFGSTLISKNGVQNNFYTQAEDIRDDFGLSYFDVVPPNSVAKDILFMTINDKGIRK